MVRSRSRAHRQHAWNRVHWPRAGGGARQGGGPRRGGRTGQALLRAAIGTADQLSVGWRWTVHHLHALWPDGSAPAGGPRWAAPAMSAGVGSGVKVALVLLLAWQSAIWLFQPPRYILPSPLDVALAFQRQPGFLASHSLTTMAEIALGFVLGSAFGALAAVAIVALPRLGRLLWPVLLVPPGLAGLRRSRRCWSSGSASAWPRRWSWRRSSSSSRSPPPSPTACAAPIPTDRRHRALTTATHWQTLRHVRLPLALPACSPACASRPRSRRSAR